MTSPSGTLASQKSITAPFGALRAGPRVAAAEAAANACVR